jgi:hypothetical protein
VTNPFGQPVQRSGLPVTVARKTGGSTAVVAGILGLGLAGALGYLPVTEFIDYGIDGAPSRLLIVFGLYLGAALLLFLGALVTFFRVLAGAVLLLIGGLAAIAAVVAEPVLLHPGLFAEFFKAMFQFGREAAFVRVAAAIGGPVVVVLSALPSTFRFLRYRPPEPAYGPPPGYPRRDW